MTDLQINIHDGGGVTLSGDINYKTVVDALNAPVFSAVSSEEQAISIDFSDVGQSDSAGLAIMVHWLREAKKRNVAVAFNNIPRKLFALAEMSNLDEVLPISSL